jgi:hypothetical protein
MIAAAVLLFAGLGTAYAQTQSVDVPRNEIEIRGSLTVPTGNADFSGTPTNSLNTIDFKRDFDFDNKLGFEVKFIHRSENQKHKFLASYGRDNWDQQRTTTRSFSFLGQTYVANAAADLGVTLRKFRVGYAYRFGNEKFRFGPAFDAGFITSSIKLTGTTNNGVRTGENSFTKFVGTIGYDLEANPIAKVMIFHTLGGMVFQGDRVFNTEGGVKVFPARHFGLVGGYKFQTVRLGGDNDNFIRVRQHGPFFGGVVRF